MQITFLTKAGTVLFVRDDIEQGNWTQEEYTLSATFPYNEKKVIHEGQRLYFMNFIGGIECFEIHKVTNLEPDHYQQIVAEHIVISELVDEHINKTEITDKFAKQALMTVLTGTLWSVGNADVGTEAEKATIRSQINALALNGNVDLTNRPIISPETMHNAGYTDFDGDYATLYSMTYTERTQDNQMNTLLVTPIKANGTVLSETQIDSYVSSLCSSSANINALKGKDTQGLLIHVLAGEQISAMDSIAESAHDLSDAWEICTQGELGSVDISRGDVWQAVMQIMQNWNCYIVPRLTFSTAGAITGRYLDIVSAEGVFRGARLSIDLNMTDPTVTYDDSDVKTALYGYGGNVGKTHATGDDTAEELTFADVVWTATSDHPAKPSGQTYIEDPAKTALYGRNGRPRFGYYQNANIKDAETLLEKTWESLKLSSDPKVTISSTISELYRLGYKGQPLNIHDLVIVEIRPINVQLKLQIRKFDVDLVDPTTSRPEIGDYIPNIIYINRETDKKSSGGGGGGRRGGMTNLEDDDEKLYTQFINTGKKVGLIVGTKDNVDYINAPQITLAINDWNGTRILLKADTIDINGLITELLAYDVSFATITTTNTATFGGDVTIENGNGLTFEEGGDINGVTDLFADSGHFDGLFVDNGGVSQEATWKSKTVVTDVSTTHTSAGWLYGDTNLNITGRSNSKMIHSVTVTTATINYLGANDS